MTGDLLVSSGTLLDHAAIRQKFEEHQKGISDHSRQLWPLVILEIWNHNISGMRFGK
jgi:hypothetical protein